MKAYSLTDKGMVRDTNQDYVYSSEAQIGKLPNLFLVADGMGGHNAGDFASKFTVEEMVNFTMTTSLSDIKEILKTGINLANTKLLEEASKNPGLSGMGTTVVAAVIKEKTLYVANVGDSRLYILKPDGRIRQVTRDHSLVQEMVRLGEIDVANAKNHPEKNIITRAVGAFETVEADIFTEELEEGDAILLCSDGLTNMVDDDEISQIIRSGRDVVESVEKLVETANKSGGKDNITCTVVIV